MHISSLQYTLVHMVNSVMGNIQGNALGMKVTHNTLRLPIPKNWQVQSFVNLGNEAYPLLEYLM